MKRGATRFLQIVIIFIGIATLAALLWEPQLEGRNAHATTFAIYLKDPFLAYAYLASISFFVILYQAFRLLGYIRQNNVFSPRAVKAVRTIKYCAVVLIVFILGAQGYLLIVQRGKDDIAGGMAVGNFMLFGSIIIATVATVFEKILQNAVDLKSENDLTV